MKTSSNAYARYHKLNDIRRRSPKYKAYIAGLFDTKFCITCTLAHNVCNWRMRLLSSDNNLKSTIHGIIGLGKVSYNQYSIGLIDSKVLVETILPYCMIKHQHGDLLLKYTNDSIIGNTINHHKYIEEFKRINNNQEDRYVLLKTIEEYKGYLSGFFDGAGKIKISEKNPQLILQSKFQKPLELLNKFCNDTGALNNKGKIFTLKWVDKTHIAGVAGLISSDSEKALKLYKLCEKFI